MKACVFVGPTVPPGDLPSDPDLVVLPPAAHGDVYRAAQSRPRAIGIVDGYFEGVLPVWHKEILWAMAEGIHVFGSASMGALRAAELYLFGMQGVGRIFEAYRDLELEDDDEVAVIHGPPETGYTALSEAMVNIRATVAAAAGVVDPATGEALVGIAKGLFYHDRSYRRVLERAAAQGLPADRLEALREWLPTGRLDQKRADALAMVAAIRAFMAERPEPMRVDYVFEWTEMWDDLTASAGASCLVDPGGERGWIADERVLEELRLDADAYRTARERALLSLLAKREADRRRFDLDPAARRRVLDRLRAEHGLFTRADLDRWLAANNFGSGRFEALLEDQARLEAISRLAEPSLRDRLLDDLRLHGDHARLARRAKDKQDRLRARGLDHPRPEDLGGLAAAVLPWYFERRLGRPLPDDLDAAARELGFESRLALQRALLREWLYERADLAPPPPIPAVDGLR
jgi:hypothetical protein